MKNMREIVRKGYNEGKYEETYARTNQKIDRIEKAFCDELIERLKGDKLLDLGCGTGMPYTKYFAKKGLKTTGVDISEKHIALAKKNVLEAKFIVGDFFSSKIKGKFDAITSFFAIFHIPRDEHQKLYEHTYNLLKKDGMILFVLAIDAMKMYKNDDFAGSKMLWSSYNAPTNKKMLEKAGFEIILSAEDTRVERHLWVLAKKK